MADWTEDELNKLRWAASEAAAYAYPGEDQQALRAAFCDGAIYGITGKVPKE